MTANARDQLRMLGSHAKKSWGQNFLQDARVLDSIAAACPDLSGRPCVEIGAGLGALTEVLLAVSSHVIAVERDRELVPHLRAMAGLAAGRLEVLEADAQQLDWAALAATAGGQLRVFGNLPYQLSSRLLVNLAEAGEHVAHATVLVQREVAERLVAAPPGRTYGLLSVLVQRHFVGRIVRHVPAGAFFPRPNVDSSVVALRARTPAERFAGGPALERALVAAARAAFASRRKTLRNSLAAALQVTGAAAEAAVLAAKLAPSARAETLSLEQFARLGRALLDAGLLEKRP